MGVGSGGAVLEQYGEPAVNMLRVQSASLMDFLLIAQLLPQDERDLAERMSGEPFDAETAAAQYFLAPGYKWVIDEPARPLAACGLLPTGEPGTYRSWFMALDRAWIEHGTELTEVVKLLIARALEDGLAQRIETVTLPERSRARAWYEKIGLKFDSTLPGYCADGADAVLYVAERG